MVSGLLELAHPAFLVYLQLPCHSESIQARQIFRPFYEEKWMCTETVCREGRRRSQYRVGEPYPNLQPSTSLSSPDGLGISTTGRSSSSSSRPGGGAPPLTPLTKCTSLVSMKSSASLNS